MSSENLKYTLPSYNPADSSEAGENEFLINQILMKIEKVAPGEVVNYNIKKNQATINVLNQSLYSNGIKLVKKSIPNIPILTLSAGGFLIKFPVKQGNTGWLVAADRDISIFKKLLKSFVPASLRKHKYEDSFFIPDYIKELNFEVEDDALIISSEDGTTQIKLQNGLITHTSAKHIINGDVEINGNTTITGDTTISGNYEITGNSQFNGTITATDTITSDTDVTASGISLKNHVHGGITPGGGSTGAPE